MTDQPRFLDEEPSSSHPSETATPAAGAPADRLGGPVLLEAEPDAPAELQDKWRPQDLPALTTSVGSWHWIVLGIAVLMVSCAVFSAIDFVLGMADRSTVLGVASAMTLILGAGLISYGLAGEWRGYRKLRIVDLMRADLAGDALTTEALRSASLRWLEQVAGRLPDAVDAIRAVQTASTGIEIQAALRNRAADPLHQAAKDIGKRAGLQVASLVAVSPHASWDGVIAGVQGLLIIREVARLFGLRPGFAVTVLLVRKVAWTAAGISGIDLLSQGLADHGLSALPIISQIAKVVPGSSLAALRLYRLAVIAATACCPVSE